MSQVQFSTEWDRSRSNAPVLSLSGHPLLRLQQIVGNRAMGRLIQRRTGPLQRTGVGIQTKLTVNEPGDQYEQEADRVAEAVMRMSNAGTTEGAAILGQAQGTHIQRVCPEGPECEEELPWQPEQEEEALRAKAIPCSTPKVTPDLGARIQGLRGEGQRLPASVRAFLEPRFGYDLGSVRIHNNDRAAQIAVSLNARAFTLGRDVVFGAGEYAPGTVKGRELLAHELTHVLQQNKERVNLPTLATPLSKVSATQIQRRVRFFVCNAADHANVESAMSASMSVANMRAAVDTASDTAAAWASNAVGLLRTSPRSAAIRSAFHDAFGANPEWVPPWFATLGARWVDFGDLIAQRLQRAAEILAGGWIQYYCWGSPTKCPECSSDPPTYRACSSYLGNYLICFGPGFWRSVAAGDTNDLTLTLLHEALHIYFSRTVAHRGRSSNAYCYRRFTAEANGLPLQARDTARCPTP